MPDPDITSTSNSDYGHTRNSGGTLIGLTVLTTTYDLAGRVITEEDALGRETAYEYDDLDRQTQVTLPDPDGTGTDYTSPVMTYEYDALGNQTRVVDARGSETEWIYDALNRVTYEVLPNPSTGIAIDDSDQSSSNPENDPSDTRTGITTQYQYDDNGNVTDVIDALGETTTTVYDYLNRSTTTTSPDPDGTSSPELAPVTTWTYDGVGNVLTETRNINSTDNAVTAYGYDVLYRQSSVSEYEDQNGTPSTAVTTHYTYYNDGNLHTVEDADGNTTTFTYTDQNLLKEETNELDKTRTYAYDELGRKTGLTDRNGLVTEYGYDVLDRLKTETWKDGASTENTIAWTYDDIGNVKTSSDNTTSYSWDYDDLDRVEKSTKSTTVAGSTQTGVFDYTFDDNGNILTRVTTINSASSTAVTDTFTYDKLDRVDLQTRTGSAIVDQQVEIDWNNLGQLDLITRKTDSANGYDNTVVITDYEYDFAHQLTDLTHTQGSTTLADYAKGSR
ncbi:hypothetical protein GC176_28040 [bacterium]|nr:hypothetical protein [bacterium]